MKEILLNQAHWMLLDYCKSEGIDPSESHIVKIERGWTYSLRNNSDGKVFCSITFTKNSRPQYWWGMAAYQRGKVKE